jgi:hypothetical protein
MPMPDKRTPKNRDERVSIPLPFEDALRGLLKVDPASVPGEQDVNGKRGKPPAKQPKK